ncbi:MAG TPA: fused MFS/spermidine synthase [Allosphingosinicella sp.]|uniref:fused MFS/spermidine synthase n=1 Tax=Allosphingosinicella sp. TaxID=2823234 RepID=UPI002ED7C673
MCLPITRLWLRVCSVTAEAAAASQGRERFAKPLFLLTILTGSFLLFLTQPMIARMALPRLGGAPAVWNSAMLVYQALLLGGYAYAHWIGRMRPRRQAGLHLALFAVAALWLPIGLSAAVPPTDFSPALWVPWFLLSSIGPLFFIVSAQAPLMQRWYALESARGEPYALYAASNLGSFAGLISYPLVVEPLMTLQQQSLLWTGGYALLVLLVAGCALTIPSAAVERHREEVSPPPSRRRVLHWIALAAVPSGLMLSTTTHLTTDIVAMPLIWVVPLGLYLLSFVVAFATRRGPTEFITQLAPLIILIAGGLAFTEGSQHPLFSATLGLSLLFVVAITLHGEMYRLRPAPDRLTGFYLAMSVGGVIGGFFCAILAPAIFDWSYEHPLLILAAALLLPQTPLLGLFRRLWADRDRAFWLSLGIALLVLLLSVVADERLRTGTPPLVTNGATILISILAIISLGRPWLFAVCLAALMMGFGGWGTLRLSVQDARTRSYFGIYTIVDRPSEQVRQLTHGTTLHGLQSLAPGRESEPTSYYGRSSGVGLALSAAEAFYGPAARIGIVGLGTGTLSCYAKPGQDWRFFEIDPAVQKIAQKSGRFTFLARCAPQAQVVLGDARLTLSRQPPGRLNVLAVDAFSSDAVPMHLLTHEALDVYARALAPDGILLMHISNRYIDLEPVLAANAEAGGWVAKLRDDRLQRGQTLHSSVWVALARDPAALTRLVSYSEALGHDWYDVNQAEDFDGWSDDYATILPLLKDFWP